MCYRYRPRLASENAEIADKLIQLTYNQLNDLARVFYTCAT